MGKSKNNTRANAYQHIYHELTFDPEHHVFDCPSDLAFFDHGKEKDQLLDLQDQLKTEYQRLIKDHLTARQQQILQLSFEGYSQLEIAKMVLNKDGGQANQSSITKCLYGNIDYSRKGVKSRYGGVAKKLKRAADNDPVIQRLRAEIQELCSIINDA